MAKKKDDKASDDPGKKKSGKGGMLFGILSKLCFTLSLASTIVLFAGLYDLGFINLTLTLSKFAAPALIVLVLASLLGPLAGMKTASSAKAAVQGEIDGLKEQISERIVEVEKKVETYLGENYNSLKTENGTLKEDAEKVTAVARKKIDDELSELRVKNEELQEQLNKAAEQMREQSMGQDTLSAA